MKHTESEKQAGFSGDQQTEYISRGRSQTKELELSPKLECQKTGERLHTEQDNVWII